MSLSNYPDHVLIRNANKWSHPIADRKAIDNNIDRELESRQPPAEYFEYDSNGNVIVSEVIGHTKDGEEIWS